MYNNFKLFLDRIFKFNWFQWPHRLRRWFVVTRLLALRVKNPPVAGVSVCYECSVLSGRGLCDQPIQGNPGECVSFSPFKRNNNPLHLIMSRQKGSLYTRGAMCILQHWDAFMQPLLLWKSYKCYIFWECVCSLRCPACNAHAPYCHLWPAQLYKIFQHDLMKGTFFFTKVIEYEMCVFISSTNFSEKCFVLGRT